jgi:hypothetical protein
MSKWVVIGSLAAIALGLGVWVTLDPQARAGAAEMWTGAKALFAQVGTEINGDALWAPVAGAFKDFANSVGGLWSGSAVKIEVPSIQLPH